MLVPRPVVAAGAVVGLAYSSGCARPSLDHRHRASVSRSGARGHHHRLAFDRWLQQDALFVADLLAFQAGCWPGRHATLRRCSPRAVSRWLRNWIGSRPRPSRGLDLPQPALPATVAYIELRRLDAAPYELAVTALWVLERVYLLAWAFAASGSSRFGEFVEHWTAPGFEGYVDALGELATPDGQDDLVGEVLSHEAAFWDMALT